MQPHLATVLCLLYDQVDDGIDIVYAFEKMGFIEECCMIGVHFNMIYIAC